MHNKEKVDAFFEFVHSVDPDSPGYSEKLKDALKYATNQDQYLRRFLDDAQIACDNGLVERIIKDFVIGRRSWLFCYSIDGAKDSATIYTLTETAKLNGANPYSYLKYLLEKMPANLERQASDRSYLEDMMPWSEAYQRYEDAWKKDLRQYTAGKGFQEEPDLRKHRRVDRVA